MYYTIGKKPDESFVISKSGSSYFSIRYPGVGRNLPTGQDTCNLNYFYRGIIYNNIILYENNNSNEQLNKFYRGIIFTGNR